MFLFSRRENLSAVNIPPISAEDTEEASPAPPANALGLFRRVDPMPTGNSTHAAGHGLSPMAASWLLDGVDLFELLTHKVKNSYLRCSYKWSFHCMYGQTCTKYIDILCVGTRPRCC
jgi:hypothetical protein